VGPDGESWILYVLDLDRRTASIKADGRLRPPPRRGSGFFADARAHIDEEIQQYPQVCLAFADPGAQKYVSVSGTAHVRSDADKIRELWSAPAKVWWAGPDDPNVRLIHFMPAEADYWDTPGNLISNIKMVFALATGTHVDAGEHKKVRL
jgi:Pyridoxamine 5'-phosphate oxidase like